MEKRAEHFRINRLPPFSLREIAEAVIAARVEGREIIDLSQLNPNLGPPGASIEKLVQASLQPHNHRYSSSQGITKLRQAMADWYLRKYHVDLDVNREVVVTLGTKQGLSHLLFATASPGDTVMVPTPCYPIHSAAILLSGAHFVGIPLPRENGSNSGNFVQQLDENSDEFFQAVSQVYETSWPRPSFMIVNFPHNPTTISVTPGFFQRLVDLARDLGFYIIHDFAYSDFAFDGASTPSILAAHGAREVAVECYSLSKGLSMPGWRVGMCAGNPVLISALKKIKSYLDCGVFQPLQIGAIRAFEQYDSLIQEVVDLYRARRDALVLGLRSIGWEVRAPKGGLFLWSKIPESFETLGSLQFSKRLLQQTNVAVSPGIGFDQHTDEFVRFALLEPEQRIRLAINNMTSFMRCA